MAKFIAIDFESSEVIESFDLDSLSDGYDSPEEFANKVNECTIEIYEVVRKVEAPSVKLDWGVDDELER